MDEVIFSALVYKWEDNTCGPTAEIDLPAAEYELRDALEKVRDGEGGETMVSVERFGNFRFLRGHLGETQDLRALNALARELAGLEPWKRDALWGMVQMDERDGMEIDVPRLYDLAASTDACQVLYDATDYTSLGRFYAENDFVLELEDVPDRAWELLDFDAIGRKMAAEENGAFIGDRGYVVRAEEIRERFGELDLTPREPEYAALMEVSCVFVGWDEDGVPRHAHVRSTNSFAKPFRINIEGGDPRYSFHHVGTDDRLYVFEAPIDMLSFITLYPRDWREHSYVACCGTSIQPVIQTGAQMDCRKAAVFLCLDNDRAGNMASERMAETFGRAGLETVRIPPRLKDWNDDLVAQRQAQEVRQWPAMCGP